MEKDPKFDCMIVFIIDQLREVMMNLTKKKRRFVLRSSLKTLA